MKILFTLTLLLLSPILHAIEPDELIVTYYVIKKSDNTPIGWDRQDTTWKYYKANREKHKAALISKYAKQGAAKVTHTYVAPGKYGFLYKYNKKGRLQYGAYTFGKTEAQRQKAIAEKKKYGKIIVDVHGTPQKIITIDKNGNTTTKGGSE